MAVSVDHRHAVEARAEAELLAELAAGDRDRALAGLYSAYGRRIYRLGVLLLRDEGLAEDLVQETFVRVWRAAGRYDASRGSARTYVLTIARRAAVDLWRRRERAALDVDEGPEREDVAGAGTGDAPGRPNRIPREPSTRTSRGARTCASRLRSIRRSTPC